MRRRNFFVRTLIFRYFGGCAGRGCRPVCGKRVAGAGRRGAGAGRQVGWCGQKEVARCGEGWGGFRTVGGWMVRRGLSCCDSGTLDALPGAFCRTSGFRVPANVSGPGGTLRATQRVIWKSCPHALSLRPEPFVEPCIAERDISTTVGGASLRVPSGSMSTGSAASSD